MTEQELSSISIQDLHIWERRRKKRNVFSFELEITARCNNNCKHCYINLPAGDPKIKEKELSFREIKSIADQTVSLGALWSLLTGGEPLLREDFLDIYLYLKKKGLLVSVFTNANLVSEAHTEVFRKYPPRNIEVTVYGITQETYEAVSRKPGSFAAFCKGLDLLLKSGLKVRLKAMALRSNVHELPQIAEFCKKYTTDYFRFDPLLHLRYDNDLVRNEEIKFERLDPEEIAAVEKIDVERFHSMVKECDKLIGPSLSNNSSDNLFHCGAGNTSFAVSYDGIFRLCGSLNHPECTYDLRQGSLLEAWHHFVPRIRKMSSDNEEFKKKCGTCPLVNLCLWCPAHAYSETGRMDAVVEYFCSVAHARAGVLKNGVLSTR